ncbi:type II secretion system F family protein [Paraburkholderia lycopersici]|uniref:Tight adherence protein B n=1 Tax=Paraburkholderia lycopersici TaxID=416944 RepID=A0A1G7BFI5_9BURK|nr:type II secretion system F family protein [Paraburkholderia lycopersici]SDE25794.1 tight adherence protein B [Paraburkholderia lycopersici]
MSSAMLLAFALLFAAAGLVLLKSAQALAARAQATRYVERRMAGVGNGLGASATGAVGQGKSAVATQTGSRGSTASGGWQTRVSTFFDQAMTRAGISNVRTSAAPIGFAMLAGCLWAWFAGGAAAMGAVFVMSGALVALVVTSRIKRRRAKLIAQLPAFLDGIVRLVVIGNSVPSAFQGALQSTETPLRECLDHVSSMLRTGVEIDRAMQHVAQIHHARELEVVGAVLRLSVRFGGRADVMLERMASFMRDLEQAQRELVALSAETRLSATVLAALPVGIATFLAITNPRYIASMWGDDRGRHLLYCAFTLHTVGAYLLYRLTCLRGAL